MFLVFFVCFCHEWHLNINFYVNSYFSLVETEHFSNNGKCSLSRKQSAGQRPVFFIQILFVLLCVFGSVNSMYKMQRKSNTTKENMTDNVACMGKSLLAAVGWRPSSQRCRQPQSRTCNIKKTRLRNVDVFCFKTIVICFISIVKYFQAM